MSSNVSISADAAPANDSGSKPRRSVNRQCSSVVSGRGRASYATSASGLAMRRVPAVQHELVAVRVLEDRHVADAAVERRLVEVELDALRLELLLRRLDVRHPQRDRARVRPLERLADVLHLQEVEADVLAELILGEALLRVLDLRQAERLAVEALRPFHVRDRHRDEVGALDDQPTDPSIWSWISRFISTAYSSGSSFVIGSTKPLTIIALASDSVSPRDMR